MTAEAARALQDTGETSVKPRMSPEELLEAEIFRAAEQASADQVAREEQARASGPEFLKIPEKSASLDDQLSGVWKARLMGANKPTPGQNTAIPSPANRVAMEAAERARTNAQHESMIGIVDRMFDQFQNLAYDFNQVASASDLELTWIRPSINRENVGNWHSGAQYISVFSGRISTRYWTLVVRGSFETITAHIIPADKLLTFNSAPANYMPMLEMMPYFDGAMVYWSAGPKQLKSEDIQQAARAVLDSLVQVAQEDVPPAKPIDLFVPPAAPTAAAPANTSFIEPNVSSLGGDIDYSERYRQHFSNDSSTNVGGNQPNSFPNPGPGQYGGATNTSASNSSVSNSSVNSFRQFPPSQPFNQASSQPLNQVNSQSCDDDWKPVVRSVRGAAGPQPLQPRPFQNVQSEPTSPTTSSSVSNSSISSTSSPPSFSSSASPTPSPSSSSFPSSPSVPSTPSFAAPPGRGQNSSSDDGWRGVDVKGPGKPSTGGTSPAFKPAFPQLPAAPAVNSDSFAGGNSQSFSGPRPSGDDWNFVPVEKEQKWPEPKSTGAPPAVNFPSNLFADMPASLGFPASAASNNNLLEPPKVEAPPAAEPSSNNFAKPAGNYPFSRPFSAKSAVKPAAAAGATPEPPTAPAPAPTPAPAPAPVAKSTPEFLPGPAPSPPAATFTPAKAPIVQPQTSTTNTDEAAQDSDDNPFFTPLTPSSSSASSSSSSSSATYSALTQQAAQTPGADTAGGVSPWAQAPAAAQGGNKADFNPTASSTQSHMIAPPPAPMPAKEPVVTSFFEPEIADDTVVIEETSDVDETSTVEIATTGQFSADRFAFDIANQAVPMPDLNQELSYLQPPAEVEPPVENTEVPADENQVEEPQSEELQSEEIQSLSDQEQQTPDALEEPELEEPELEEPELEEPELEEPELEELAAGEAETEAETVSEPELKIDSDPDSEVAFGAEVEQKQKQKQEQEQELDPDSELDANPVADESPEELDSDKDELEESQPLEELIESRVSEDSDELSESAIQESAAEDASDYTSDNQEQLEQDDNLPSDDSSEEIADDLNDSEIAESDSDESELDDNELQETAAAEEADDAEEAETLVDEEQDLEQVLDSGLDSDVDSGQDAEQELELDSTELELDRLAEIEEETVESIAELEQELAQTTEELHQSGFNSSEDSQADHPWRGPDSSDGPSSDTATNAGVESGTQFNQYSMPSFTPISTSLGTSAPYVVAASEHSLKNEIDRVITAFDKELELISTKGSDAFARRDLKGAEHMIKLAEMISEYKAGLAKLKDEYDQDLT